MKKRQQQKIRRELFTGDNLDIMRGMDTACVDMIYLDPPFNSGKNWGGDRPIGVKKKTSKATTSKASFSDVWKLSDVRMSEHSLLERDAPKLYSVIDALHAVNGGSWKAYLTYMGMRLLEMRRILKPEGCIFYHCDPVMSHGIKLVMDAVFGKTNFRNEIVWRKYAGRKNNAKHKLSTQHDCIFLYGASDEAGIIPLFIPHSAEEIEREYKYTTPAGRRYRKSRGRNYQLTGEEKRIYLDKSPGRAVGTLWVEDGLQLNTSAQERVGYPTQKPLSLLERIIKLASNKDDLVLDPFCGCATTCVAAERLDRQWIGIDISEVAADIVMRRLNDETVFMDKTYVRHRTDIPLRSDSPPPSKDIKIRLYGRQGGFCNGCGNHFYAENLEIDHIIPRAAGGRDTDVNLQLLCNYCNRVKGDRDMAYLFSKLRKTGKWKLR